MDLADNIIMDEYTQRESLMRSDDLREMIRFNPENKSSIDEYFSVPQNQRIVLIHPVRISDSVEPDHLKRFKDEQRMLGNKVYIPKDFNFQQDETSGVAICNTMRYVIGNCRKIAIDYDPKSEGSKVDLGMAIYKNKPFTLLNRLEEGDIFYHWKLSSQRRNLRMNCNVKDFDREFWKRYAKVQSEDAPKIKFEYMPRPGDNGQRPLILTPQTALHFGMILASEKPFKVVNISGVLEQISIENDKNVPKSYSKVALKLHRRYNPV